MTNELHVGMLNVIFVSSWIFFTFLIIQSAVAVEYADGIFVTK